MTGCSGGSGGTGLQAALARVADTANTRSQIWYDDTAALASLGHVNLASPSGYGRLVGLGASTLASLAVLLPHNTGINLLGEDFAITAGRPPTVLTLLAGGQRATLVSSRLTKLGWKRKDGILVGPPLQSASLNASQFALPLARVLPSGADVVFGDSGANLSQIGAPSGPTLASNSRLSALAGCLGDVVAAAIFYGGYLGGRGPAAVAVGVSRPASATATPHAVACVSWASRTAAARYAADVQRALASGSSSALGARYSVLLRHASVTNTGGGYYLVQWQADTPGHAELVFEMALQVDLPALPDCAKQTAGVAGCP